MAVTLQQVITSIRELSFDRFVTPCFYIGSSKPNYVITITSTELSIIDKTSSTVKTQLSFSSYPTLRELVEQLLASAENYEISYAASFIDGEASTSLLPATEKPLTTPIPIFRRNFFGDTEITNVIGQYYEMVLGIKCDALAALDLNTSVTELTCRRPEHMICWCAYWIVDKRRLYELAGEVLGQSTFSFSNQAGMIGLAEEGAVIDMSIGDVFRLSDNPKDSYNMNENPAGVGADNVLGDAQGFWYRLQLWLRSKIERLFGDFSLRPDTIMVGQIDLQIDRNFYAFYDSYPYTVSPLSREIMSSFEFNN